MNPYYLIGMSLWDFTTAQDDRDNIFEFPICAGSTGITSTFGCNDIFYDFPGYDDKLFPEDVGELTFGSRVGVQAVMYLDIAEYKDIEFAKSYVGVYDLPILLYNMKINTVERCK